MERPKEAQTSKETPAPSTLASRLVFSFNAELNFDLALTLGSGLDNSYLVSQISQSLAEAGKTEDEIKNLLSGNLKNVTQETLSTNMALGYAKRGNYASAEQLLQRGDVWSGWYTQVATVKAKNGDDPSDVYKLALEKAKRQTIDATKVRETCAVITSMSEVGIQADKELEELVSGMSQDEIEIDANSIAETFVALGIANRAVEFAQMGKYNTQRYIDQVLCKSARALIKKGETEQALEVANKTGDSEFITEITRKSVLYQAENGVKNESLYSRLQIMSAGVLNNPNTWASKKVEFACDMAKIKKAYGEDPSAMLGLALNIAAEGDDDYLQKIDLLTNIAKTKAGLGQNAAPIFGLLFESTEHLYKLSSAEDADKLDRMELLMAVEDLTQTALDLGFLHEADKLIHHYLEKIVDEELDDEVIVSQVDMIAKLAVAQAKKGLTKEEITAISIEEVEALLKSNSHKTHEAIGYFNLADDDLIKSQKPQTRVSVAIGNSKKQKDLNAQIDAVSAVYTEDRSVSSTKAFVEGLVSTNKDLASVRLLDILQQEIASGGNVKVISRLLKGLLEAEDPKAREIAVDLFKNDSYPNNFRVYLARKLCDSGYWDRQIAYYFRNYKHTMTSDMRASRDAQIESLSAIVEKMHINPNIDVYKTLEKTKILKDKGGFENVVDFGAEVLSLADTDLETKIAIFSFWTNKYLEGEIDHDQLEKLSKDLTALSVAEEAYFKINKFPKDSYHIKPVVKNLYKSELLSTNSENIISLMESGYFPTQRLVDFVDGNGKNAINELNALKSETSEGRLNFDNALQIDIEYGKYLKLYQGKSADPYQQFLSIESLHSEDIQRELDLHEKMEAEAAAYEAAVFYWFVRERVEKGRKVTVVGNQRYGDYFVVNPLRSHLEEIGVTLSSYKVGSSGASQWSVEKIFPPSFLDFMIKTHSDVVIVDGTPNITGAGGSPRLPSALYGYHNWFQAYNHAAGATESLNDKLSESTKFKELAQEIKESSPTRPYKISFWVPKPKKHVSPRVLETIAIP